MGSLSFSTDSTARWTGRTRCRKSTPSPTVEPKGSARCRTVGPDAGTDRRHRVPERDADPRPRCSAGGETEEPTSPPANAGSPPRRLRRRIDRDHRPRPDPATEIFATPPVPPGRPRTARPAVPHTAASPKTATPQSIPPRRGTEVVDSAAVSWGWVLAILVIAALAAVAILGTVLLTRHDNAVGRRRKTRCARRSRASTSRSRRAIWRRCAASPAARPRDSYVKYDERAVGRHPRPGRGGQAVSGGGQHRPGRRQRRARRGQRHHVHGLRPSAAVDPQLRPTVPRRAVEDLPGPPQRASAARR